MGYVPRFLGEMIAYVGVLLLSLSLLAREWHTCVVKAITADLQQTCRSRSLLECPFSLLPQYIPQSSRLLSWSYSFLWQVQPLTTSAVFRGTLFITDCNPDHHESPKHNRCRPYTPPAPVAFAKQANTRFRPSSRR